MTAKRGPVIVPPSAYESEKYSVEAAVAVKAKIPFIEAIVPASLRL